MQCIWNFWINLDLPFSANGFNLFLELSVQWLILKTESEFIWIKILRKLGARFYRMGDGWIFVLLVQKWKLHYKFLDKFTPNKFSFVFTFSFIIEQSKNYVAFFEFLTINIACLSFELSSLAWLKPQQILAQNKENCTKLWIWESFRENRS